MTFRPDNPFAPKPVYRRPNGTAYPVSPLRVSASIQDSVDDLMRRLAQQKPEPSLTTLGRAKAKGTGLEWVSPRMSPLETLRYNHLKRYGVDTFGIPITPQRVVADATAAPLTQALARWVQSR